MANVWMHNGFLQVEGEKMSKSLGNFITINDLLKTTPGEAIRLAMLTTHYRQPIDWTAKGAAEARRTLDNWFQLTADVKAGSPDPDFIDALADDMNTPKAISILHELRREAASGNGEAARTLKGSAQLIGLLQLSAKDWASWRPADVEIDENEIAKKIEERAKAKAEKDFATADRIRDQLAAEGITLKDGPERYDLGSQPMTGAQSATTAKASAFHRTMPVLEITDMERSISFYRDKLGFAALDLGRSAKLRHHAARHRHHRA